MTCIIDEEGRRERPKIILGILGSIKVLIGKDDIQDYGGAHIPSAANTVARCWLVLLSQVRTAMPPCLPFFIPEVTVLCGEGGSWQPRQSPHSMSTYHASCYTGERRARINPSERPFYH